MIAAILLGLACAGLAVHALFYPFVTDDAYISFRYSWNLAFHDQLVFNPGERVEGYTNFLWTLTLGLLLKAQLRPEVMSRVLGVLFGASILVLLHVLSRLYRGGRPTGWDFLGSLLLPATGTFAVWCSGGLETQMFSALGFGGMVLYLAEEGGHVRRRFSGLLFAFAAMTRPEGLLLFGLTGLHLAAAHVLRGHLLPRREHWLWLLGFLLPFGAFFAWRYSYYGYPLPNTFYVKAGEGAASESALRWGIPYLWDFVNQGRLYVLLLFLPLFWPRTTWRRDGKSVDNDVVCRGLRPAFVWSYLGLILVTYVAYVVSVGGDFMAMGRFFAPLWPILAFLAQEAVRETLERPRRAPGAWRPARMVPAAVLLLGLSSANSVLLHREAQKMAYHRWGLDTVAYLDRFAADRVLVGTWMRRNLPPDTFLAVGGAGAIVYASRMRALDTFGLNDAWIAHNTPRTGDRPGHTKSAPEDYVLAQKPDVMCHQAKHQDWEYRASPEEAEMWRRRGYGWACIAPPGLRPSHYCCLRKLDRKLGPWPAEQ